jgi:FtsZ-binding cell division protein ZapB
MAVEEFQELRDKIQALIEYTHSLRQEHKSFAEKLLVRERQIRELRERCEQSEQRQKEAYQRISAILSRFDALKL